MECGGIWPCKPIEEELEYWKCHQCRLWQNAAGKWPDHHCKETDSVLHGDCVEEFLKTADGMTVISHNHLIQIYDQVLQEGIVNEPADDEL